MTTLFKLCFGLLLLSFSISTICAESDALTSKETKKRSLDTFGFEIFNRKLAGHNDGYHRVRVAEIVKKFGEPMKTNSVLRDHPDPSPDGPLQYEELVWYYDGLVIQMKSPIISSKSQAAHEVWIERVVISSSIYALANGLRIGQPISKFVDTLGDPTRRSSFGIEYDIDNEVEVRPNFVEVTPYQIAIKVDRDDNVREVEWTWWWH